MTDPYNSHSSPVNAAPEPAAPPIPTRMVMQRKTAQPKDWVAFINWAVVVVVVATAIYKHIPFGSVLFLLIPIAFALLSKQVIQSEVFSIVARAINGIFALLFLAKLLGLSPYAPALLSLSLFVILVAVPAFNVVFLSPAGEE
ncbi:hypothetical protein J2X04_002207 [Lysobacter niabensis]|uniref:AI-2E family transporter n=1 Tax=Agrilutibacter niabensis TaxID=380628 RepID=A0ABU1VQS6_9GAMM|nr:hypothetical protein [Lysobacter niabensis]MDR7099826.1 hypothetical protein [Lysobacter niabensis]